MSILTIAYSSDIQDNKVIIKNSQGDSITSDSSKELLNFLGKNYTDALNRKLTWNLDTFIAPILKLLGMDICKELVKEPDNEALWEFTQDSIRLHQIENKPPQMPDDMYSLYYHRQTSIGLQVHGERKSYFYNLCQFFEDDELDIKDPQEILKYAKELVDAFFSMGLNPLKMSSPISAFQSAVLEHIDFPTVADIPDNLLEADTDELLDWSEQIMHREWTTSMAVGHWDKGETWDFDLQSAYGYLFSELYNFRYANFWKSDTPIKEAEFGILKGSIKINPNVKCSPICYQKENGQIINPVGCSWNDLFTLPEIRWIYRYGIGTFEMDYGYFWKQDAPVQPFKIPMQRIFNHREKGGLVKKLAKRIGASAWAKCIQKSTNDGINKYYSPLLALQVKTNCRLMVADFIYKNNLQDSVLHIGTDGVRATKKADIPKVFEMGKWKENEQDSCIILSPGRIYTPQHKPGGLYYDDIVNMINKSPNDTYYATHKSRRLTLGEAIETNDLKSVGNLQDFQTSIDLTTARTEQDMVFDDFPTCGKELLNKKYYGKSVIIKE